MKITFAERFPPNTKQQGGKFSKQKTKLIHFVVQSVNKMPVSVWEKLGLSIECLVDVMTLERMKWEHEVKMRCLQL